MRSAVQICPDLPISARFWGLSSAGRAPALHAGGQRFDPARLHHPTVPAETSGKSIDFPLFSEQLLFNNVNHADKRSFRKKGTRDTSQAYPAIVVCHRRPDLLGLYGQAMKRIRWMPRQPEAMKDVEACDKARRGGKQPVTRACLNGETHSSSDEYPPLNI